MKRNIKTFALALTTVFAISVPGVSAASAAEFHWEAAPLTLSATQATSHVLTTTSGTFTCKTATFSGDSFVTTTTTITMTPNYDNCTAFGFISVPVHENGCDYVIHANGTTEIKCPSGKEIEIPIPGCTTTIGPQHIASGKTFTNVTREEPGPPNAHVELIIMHTAFTGITYRECGGVLQHGGTYTGTTTMSGGENNIRWT